MSLPQILLDMKAAYAPQDKARTFNQTRALVLGFVNKKCGGKHSALYTRVQTISPIDEVDSRKKRKRENRLTQLSGLARPVRAVLETVEAMQHPQGEQFWTMTLLGMGNKEYQSGFEVFPEEGRVHVHGMKRETRDRDLPLISAQRLNKHPSAVKYIRAQLRKVQPEWQLYDARRTFSHWMDECGGISKIRRKAYMGHKVRDVHDNYTAHELRDYLVKDGKALRDYIITAALDGLKAPCDLDRVQHLLDKWLG